jgi:hypothetical protein
MARPQQLYTVLKRIPLDVRIAAAAAATVALAKFFEPPAELFAAIYGALSLYVAAETFAGKEV